VESKVPFSLFSGNGKTIPVTPSSLLDFAAPSRIMALAGSGNDDGDYE
jgi:hypothetical protein